MKLFIIAASLIFFLYSLYDRIALWFFDRRYIHPKRFDSLEKFFLPEDWIINHGD